MLRIVNPVLPVVAVIFGASYLSPLAVAQPASESTTAASDRSGDGNNTSESSTVAADLYPSSTIFYAEITDPVQLVSLLFDGPVASRVVSLDVYQQAMESEPAQRFQMGRRFLELHFAMGWRDAVKTLADGGAALGVDTKSGGAAIVLIGKDSDSMRQFHNKLVELIKNTRGADQLREGVYREIPVYAIDDAKFAAVGRRLVMTNNETLGKHIIDRMLDASGETLAQQSRFAASLRTRPSDGSAWAYLDVEAARDQKLREKLLSGRASNPVIEVLFGGLQSNLRETPFLTGEMSVKESSLEIALRSPHRSEWISEQRDYFFGPEGDGQAPPAPEVEKTLLTLSTYRNLSEMWLRAGDLFDRSVVDEFAKADASLTTLFAGHDFGEEILGAIEPELSLVATGHARTDELPEPTIKLPQFGLVTQLREPETMRPDLRRTFESLVGFLNIVGAMEGRNQMELGRESLEKQAELVTATFVPEEHQRDSSNAGIIWNFSPSIGFSGDRFVVASTKRLARELTEAESHGEAGDGANTFLQLHADVLRQLLKENREQLIAQNMLEEGHSREEAEAEVEMLVELIGFAEKLEVGLKVDDDQLKLLLRLDLAATR